MFSALLEILGGKGGGVVERFVCETTVISGEGSLSALGELRSRRMLVVTEPLLRQNGQAGKVIREALDPETEFWEDCFREPVMRQAVEGSRKIREFRPDLVVALGGGGVLDLGKAMTCFSGHSCILATVPTAFGTGAEVTDRVTLHHDGRAHQLRDRGMRPRLAILDSGLTGQPSRRELGEWGFELLAASLEAYTALGGDFFRDIHGREAFAAGWAALPAAVAGSAAAFQRMQAASVLTGLALDRTGLGLCRALENSLGLIFGIPRGRAAAIVLPAVIGCNAHGAGRRYAELSRAAGLGGSREEIGIRNLRTGLVRMRRELGLPGTLVQAGVDVRSVWSCGKRLAELTLEDPECRNNPVAVDDFLIRRILEEITGRL